MNEDLGFSLDGQYGQPLPTKDCPSLFVCLFVFVIIVLNRLLMLNIGNHYSTDDRPIFFFLIVVILDRHLVFITANHYSKDV